MSDTPVVGRITFDPQPDIVGLARIKIDGRFYGMPAWVVEQLAAMTKERDSAWNDAITEVIALVVSGKGDDQALLRQRIRALKRKEQS